MNPAFEISGQADCMYGSLLNSPTALPLLNQGVT